MSHSGYYHALNPCFIASCWTGLSKHRCSMTESSCIPTGAYNCALHTVDISTNPKLRRTVGSKGRMCIPLSSQRNRHQEPRDLPSFCSTSLHVAALCKSTSPSSRVAAGILATMPCRQEGGECRTGWGKEWTPCKRSPWRHPLIFCLDFTGHNLVPRTHLKKDPGWSFVTT